MESPNYTGAAQEMAQQRMKQEVPPASETGVEAPPNQTGQPSKEEKIAKIDELIGILTKAKEEITVSPTGELSPETTQQIATLMQSK